MKLTSIQFYRLALLFPYVAGLILAGIAQLLGPFLSSNNSGMLESQLELVQAIIYVVGIFAGFLMVLTIAYGISAIYWLVPYTIVAIFLFVWSLKKNKSQIYKMFMWSPVFLAALITIQIALIAYLNLLPDFNPIEMILPISLACAFPASIALGYFFIGLTAWIYDFLRRRGRVMDEEIVLNLENKRS